LRNGGLGHPGRGDGEIVDQYFDRDLSPNRRRELLEGLGGERCEEVVRTNHALYRLKEPVESIDVADVVLQRVHARRAFLPRRVRSMIKAGRLGLAAVVLLALLSVVLLQRYNPGALQLHPGEAPLSAVMEQSEHDTATGLHTLSDGINELKSLVVRVASVETEGELALELREPRRREVLAAESGRDDARPTSQLLVFTAAHDRLSPVTASGGLGGNVFAIDGGEYRPTPAMTAGICAPRGVGPATVTARRWSITTPVAGREASVVGAPAVSATPVSLNMGGPVLEMLSGAGDQFALPPDDGQR
jgi:hypothetical protein